MARTPASRHLVVRDAVADDAAELVTLWAGLVAEGIPGGRAAEPPSEAAVRDRLAGLAAAPDRRLLVAVDAEHGAVGAMHLVSQPLTPLHDEVAVRICYLHVAPPARRRGVGHALLGAALAWAEQLDAAHVVADASPTAREMNRFLARLGFGQLLVQRSASVPALRRRLGTSSASEEVAARRASLRVRAHGRMAAAVTRGAPARRRGRRSVPAGPV